MDKKCVYFAHPVTHYNTNFEWECIDVILTMLTPIEEKITEGHISIMNPNQKWLSQIYKNRKNNNHEDIFGIFNEIVLGCDIIVGVSFFDGTIGAGVATELKTSIENGKEAYLIYIIDGIKLFLPCSSLDNYKVLTIEETREKIKKEEM